MIGECYDTLSTLGHTVFRFESIGIHGAIQKAVVFQKIGGKKYNLAFGDVTNNDLDDAVISNNLDYVKVMNTVAKTAYLFIEKYPEATIHIEAVDDKRLKFYNAIFRRHFPVIQRTFLISGLMDGGLEFENYQPEKSYVQFELKLK